MRWILAAFWQNGDGWHYVRAKFVDEPRDVVDAAKQVSDWLLESVKDVPFEC